MNGPWLDRNSAIASRMSSSRRSFCVIAMALAAVSDIRRNASVAVPRCSLARANTTVMSSAIFLYSTDIAACAAMIRMRTTLCAGGSEPALAARRVGQLVGLYPRRVLHARNHELRDTITGLELL